jgi:hypothetical protein
MTLSIVLDPATLDDVGAALARARIAPANIGADEQPIVFLRIAPDRQVVPEPVLDV